MKTLHIKAQMFDFTTNDSLPKDIYIYDTVIKAKSNQKNFTPKKILIDKKSNYIISVIGELKKSFPSGTSINKVLQSLTGKHNTKLYTNVDKIIAIVEHSITLDTDKNRYYLKGECNVLEVEYI